MEEITIDFIKSEMKELGISRKEICKDFDISQQTLSKWLNPKSSGHLKTAVQKSAFRFYFLYRRQIAGNSV